MEPLFYSATYETEQTHWWAQGRVAILSAVLARYLARGGDAKILEIGAGGGVNIPLLQEFGRVDAVEMHPGGRARIARRFSGAAVRDGALPDPAVFAGQTYNVVCLFDVLEHIDADVAALAVIRENMHPDGFLFLTAPAYQWLWSRQDESNRHFRRYNAAALRRALDCAGWRVEQIGYFNMFLFPLALCARLADRVFRPQIPTGVAVPNRIVNGLFRRIFAAEAGRVAKGGFPFGLSLLAVARPKAADDGENIRAKEKLTRGVTAANLL